MTDVVMPQMGESIVEGTLTKWLKKPGERIERDEPLFEISTDKVDTEIPSPAAGTLSEILVEEGKTVGINTVVARIDEGGGAAAAKPAAKPAAAPAPPPAAPAPPAAAAAAARRRAAPPAPKPAAASPPRKNPPDRSRRWSARWRANSISISTQVKGTGAGGRITKQDVEAYAAAQSQPRGPAPPRRPRRAAAAPRPGRPAAPPAMAPLPPAGQAKTRIEPMSTMRIKIAEHMVMSKRTSRARHHRPSRRHDQSRQDARAPQGAVPGGLRFRPHLPAVHHARRGGRPAPVSAAQRLARSATTSSTTTKFISASPSRWKTA